MFKYVEGVLGICSGIFRRFNVFKTFLRVLGMCYVFYAVLCSFIVVYAFLCSFIVFKVISCSFR